MEGQDLKEKFNNFCAKGVKDPLWAEDEIYRYLI